MKIYGQPLTQGILYTICKGPFVLVWQVNAGFMGLASGGDITGFSWGALLPVEEGS